MKKYIILILLFFLFLVFNIDNSFGFVDCNNSVIYPREVTSKNVVSYLNDTYYKEIKSICSYDCCYTPNEGDLSGIVKGFNAYCYPEVSDEDKLVVDVKGIAVTKLLVDSCR